MQIELLRFLHVERKFGGPLRFGVIEFRFDTCWNENPGYRARYWRTEICLRWPWRLKFRLDLTRYGEGGYLEPHLDPVYEGERQYNCIFVLRAPERGGELLAERFVYCGSRLKIIEPNLYLHELTPVEKGERIVLNLGIYFAVRRIPPRP